MKRFEKVGLCVCVSHAGRDLVCQGVSLDRSVFDDEDDPQTQKRRLIPSSSPESPE